MGVKEHITDALDVLALLLIAAGVLVGLWPHVGGWSIACGGAVVWLGVRVIDGDVTELLDAVKRKRDR